jgi:hypothetical protein
MKYIVKYQKKLEKRAIVFQAVEEKEIIHKIIFFEFNVDANETVMVIFLIIIGK